MESRGPLILEPNETQARTCRLNVPSDFFRGDVDLGAQCF